MIKWNQSFSRLSYLAQEKLDWSIDLHQPSFIVKNEDGMIICGDYKCPSESEIREKFVDKTGFEVACNSWYLMDFPEYKTKQFFSIVFNYVSNIMAVIERLSEEQYIIEFVFQPVIIHNHLDNVYSNFHVVRSEEDYLEKELDLYEEPLLVLAESTDHWCTEDCKTKLLECIDYLITERGRNI